MPDESLLSILRELPPAAEPNVLERMLKELVLLNNNIDDVKRKLDVANELAIQESEERRGGIRSDFGSQASPIKSNSPLAPRPIRRARSTDVKRLLESYRERPRP